MRYRKHDDDGDMTFGAGGNNFYVDNAEAVAQSVQTRLMLFRGEWFLDTGEGTPWLTDILGEHTQDTYNLEIRARILGTSGVTEISEYSSVIDTTTRRLSISATINTIYGQAQIEAEL